MLNNKTELCNLFFKHLSDKCPEVNHTYSLHYYDLLKDKKHLFKNVLEIGVGYYDLMKHYCGENYQIGASLKGWRDFFPNAKIYGLDIREEVLFTEERIECFYTDQSNAQELNKTIDKIRKSNNVLFDLIIDDGSHIIDHQILSFQTLSLYVKNGGYYIIEDINIENIDLYANLQTNGFQVAKTHRGISQFDGFIAYKRTSPCVSLL